ncbi:unnamed protein product [Trichobilharzia szidati]|nr:unnamed protein product [Trichobilharzia szidati]
MISGPIFFRFQLVPQLFIRLEHSNLPNFKKRAPGHTLRPFICSKRVVVKAGDGGNGCIAFRRIFCNPHGGPSGGDGGNGAHIIFKADKNISDLSRIPTMIKGNNGINGLVDNCHGANADHVYVKVPLGTKVFSVNKTLVNSEDNVPKENKSIVLVKTLQSENEIFLAARGGAGGKGNAFMTCTTTAVDSMKVPSNRNTPLRIAERGGVGESSEFILRMSKLADLGFVGCPNAGKSTLLKCLTRARPKIAPYPFTTLKPNVGILNLLPESHEQPYSSTGLPSSSSSANGGDKIHSIAIADLPGIIDGAADYNKGLGAEFLSLIADCSVLAYVIDCGTLWCNYGVDKLNDFEDELTNQLSMLHYEITTYDANLGDQNRCIVLGSKLDLILLSNKTGDNYSDTDLVETLHCILHKTACKVGIISDTPESKDRVMLVSAKRGDNIQQLMHRLLKYVKNSDRQTRI